MLLMCLIDIMSRLVVQNNAEAHIIRVIDDLARGHGGMTRPDLPDAGNVRQERAAVLGDFFALAGGRIILQPEINQMDEHTRQLSRLAASKANNR